MTALHPPPAEERTVTLSTTATGWRVPRARDRAVNPILLLPLRRKIVGWLAPLGVTLLALGLRLWHLGTPHVLAFDETYYAKDAWSLLNKGLTLDYKSDVDGNPKTDINADILAGHVHDLWTNRPELAVHPDVGKWLIAVGEHFWGMDPFGWRIASAVAGSLMVLVMCRLARRMTGSTLLGCVAGLLLMFDGLEFVLSRLALLDIFVGLWLLCAMACVIADRDWHRARVAGFRGRRWRPWVLQPPPAREPGIDASAYDPAAALRERNRWGPRILLRPWLLLAGVCFGLACGTKWDAAYPLAVFGLMCFFWSAGARRMTGVRWSLVKGALIDGVPAFLQLVLVAVLVYIATWGGWLAHADRYEKDLSSTQYTQYTGHGHCAKDDDSYVATQLDPSKKWPTAKEPDAHGVGELWQSLRSLWYYHQDVYTFHTHFLNCSTHFYESKPSSWLLLNRPVGVAVTNDIKPGTDGCDAPRDSNCIRQVLLLGNPVIWWGGCIALIFAVLMWVGARDWRYGVAVLGTLSTWLPWLQYDDRPIFIFYAIAILPFVVLALTLAIGTMIGPSRLPSFRRTAGVVAGGAFVVLAVVFFAVFWPVYTDQLITHSEWLQRIWFQRWV